MPSCPSMPKESIFRELWNKDEKKEKIKNQDIKFHFPQMQLQTLDQLISMELLSLSSRVQNQQNPLFHFLLSPFSTDKIQLYTSYIHRPRALHLNKSRNEMMSWGQEMHATNLEAQWFLHFLSSFFNLFTMLLVKFTHAICPFDLLLNWHKEIVWCAQPTYSSKSRFHQVNKPFLELEWICTTNKPIWGHQQSCSLELHM